VRLGDTQNFSERPMRSRSHAAPLVLERGVHHDLLMRVETTSTMVLPISLVQIDSFNAREASAELLQGLLTGIGLCLFVYSLAQWVSLRDRMFLFYAVATSGSTPFFFAYYGLGPQHLWGESQWLTQNAAPFTVLIGLVGIFQFVPRALDVRSVSRRLVKVMQALSVVAAITAAAFVVGLVSYRAAQTIATVLGPLPMLMMVHTAFVRWRRGDRAAGYMLVGWGVYLVGVVVMAMLLRGFVGANFWTQHAFQFALTFEMAVWMLVLGVRIDEIRAAAEAAHRERDLLHSMAHTDALTGLLNRRGLQAAAEPMLRNASPQHVTAIYLLDLDGFKPVNDTYGHDVGDELLKLVGRRLQAQLRVSDRVARLGGDEFVIAVSALPRETEAERVGQKLLAAFQEPFDVSGHSCRVGLTIGYALAPHDGRDLPSLLKRADAAMYAGKQAGKNRVQRGAASAGLAAA
jgi:diguanylate cyclase (GGDEF)-like protein